MKEVMLDRLRGCDSVWGGFAVITLVRVGFAYSGEVSVNRQMTTTYLHYQAGLLSFERE